MAYSEDGYIFSYYIPNYDSIYRQLSIIQGNGREEGHG
jgi:hypothetical protein